MIYITTLRFRVIEITGFLKIKFNFRNSNNKSEYVGNVTDGCYTLNVIIKNVDEENLDCDIGSQLEIIGDIQEEGCCAYFLIN